MSATKREEVVTPTVPKPPTQAEIDKANRRADLVPIQYVPPTLSAYEQFHVSAECHHLPRFESRIGHGAHQTAQSERRGRYSARLLERAARGV